MFGQLQSTNTSLSEDPFITVHVFMYFSVPDRSAISYNFRLRLYPHPVSFTEARDLCKGIGGKLWEPIRDEDMVAAQPLVDARDQTGEERKYLRE